MVDALPNFLVAPVTSVRVLLAYAGQFTVLARDADLAGYRLELAACLALLALPAAERAFSQFSPLHCTTSGGDIRHERRQVVATVAATFGSLTWNDLGVT